ncbi:MULTISPECIES: polyprenyl synthetase family protein [unclassified Streptococcus]|uniref:polyprenyl synthetase family protein n=1 Tax=unclassified Streptococcus TaxID=2608887 RepID=UPI00359DCFA3
MVHPIWDDFPQVQAGLIKVRQIMLDESKGLPGLIGQEVARYITAPGKYLRSGLILLVALELDGELREGRYYLAAALELFHLATLVHDDVIDGASYRRGIEALHQVTSNRLAIYTGDYLLTKAGHLATKGLQLLGLKESPDGLKDRLIDGVLVGEIRQLLNHYNLQITFKDYLKQIQGKTALLFSLACQGGSLRVGSSPRELQLAHQAGRALGMAFQLADDLLDYEQALGQSGKPRFQDVQNGIYTAPILYAFVGYPDFKGWINERQKHGWSEEDLQILMDKLATSQALEKTRRLKIAYLAKAERAFKELGISSQSLAKLSKKI